MKGIFGCILAILLVGSGGVAAAADRYEVTVTRKASNFYKVDGTKLWIQTRHCYTYGYSEDAIVSSYELIFLDQSDRCDVRRILKESDIFSGSYRVTVTYEDSDMYSTYEGVHIMTSLCLELSYGEDAILRPLAYGGELIFLDSGTKCSVEQIFNEVRL